MRERERERERECVCVHVIVCVKLFCVGHIMPCTERIYGDKLHLINQIHCL